MVPPCPRATVSSDVGVLMQVGWWDFQSLFRGQVRPFFPIPAPAAVTPHCPPSASLPHLLLQLRLRMLFPASPRDLLSYFMTLHILQLGSGRDPAGLAGAFARSGWQMWGRGAAMGQGDLSPELGRGWVSLSLGLFMQYVHCPGYVLGPVLRCFP